MVLVDVPELFKVWIIQVISRNIQTVGVVVNERCVEREIESTVVVLFRHILNTQANAIKQLNDLSNLSMTANLLDCWNRKQL